jgi:hypothetical protein
MSPPSPRRHVGKRGWDGIGASPKFHPPPAWDGLGLMGLVGFVGLWEGIA